MILVDTSVWVDHFRAGTGSLGNLLDEGVALCHPFVIGELACGRLGNREEILQLLDALPAAPVATHAEVRRLVSEHGFVGTGVGWVDAHLLASTLLAHTSLWTRDRALQAAATRLGICA
jgi:predicted nucleic acid-binding protein